jgi:hypothetical protein
MIKEYQLTLSVTLFTDKDAENLCALVGHPSVGALEDFLDKYQMNRYLYKDVRFVLESKPVK